MKRLEIRIDAYAGLTARLRGQAEEQAERLAEFFGLQAELTYGHVEPRGHM